MPEISSGPARSLRIDMAYLSLIASVTISTLAFGSVEQWSMALMQTLVFIGLLSFLIRSAIGHTRCYRVPGLLPLLLILLYMSAQALPLPPGLLKVLSPAAYEAYSSTVLPDSPGAWLPLTLFRRGLVLEFLRFASYAGVYVLTVELMTRGSRLKRTAYIAAGFASILAFLSIIANFTSGTEILWIRDNPWGDFHFGPYINKNHYAGFMGMVLPLIIGLFLATRPRVSDSVRDIRSRIVTALSSRRISEHVLFGLGAVAVSVSIVLSLSRSGIAATCISILVLAAIVLRRQRVGKAWIGLLVTAVALSLGWFGLAPVIDRFGAFADSDGLMLGQRGLIFIDSVRAAWDFILTGGGFGAFSDIYPAYRTLEGTLLVDHAHNDYLEFMVEGGLISLVLSLWFISSIVIFVIKNLPDRGNFYSIYICYGSSVGILYMLLHSFTDFNLHVGANGLFFFFLVGMSVSASATSFRSRKQTSLFPCSDRAKYAGLLLVLALGFFSIWINVRYLSASSAYRIYTETSNSNESTVPSMFAGGAIRKAVLLDGLNPVYRLRLAAENGASFEFDSAVSELGTALRYSPLCGQCLQALASITDMAGEENRAEKYLEASLKYGARWTDKYLRYGAWLSAAGQRDEGLGIFGQGLAAEPGRADEYVEAMSGIGYSVEEINTILPESHEAVLALAEKALSSGKTDFAVSLLDRTFALIVISESVDPSDYNVLYYLNLSLKRYDIAYSVIARGVSEFDDNPYLKAAQGREQERRGEFDRALESYRDALILNPSNMTALKGVERLTR